MTTELEITTITRPGVPYFDPAAECFVAEVPETGGEVFAPTEAECAAALADASRVAREHVVANAWPVTTIPLDPDACVRALEAAADALRRREPGRRADALAGRLEEMAQSVADPMGLSCAMGPCAECDALTRGKCDWRGYDGTGQ